MRKEGSTSMISILSEQAHAKIGGDLTYSIRSPKRKKFKKKMNRDEEDTDRNAV